MKRLTASLLGIMIFAISPAAHASDKLTSLLATLSAAKAQVEGRAQRVISCAALQSPTTLVELRGKYETARNHFNGRIDAWLFSLQKRKDFKFDPESEAKDMGAAIAKVNEFIVRSDAALTSAPCATKVFWKEALLAVISIAPALIESIKSFWIDAGASESERLALVGALEQHKIAEWGGATTLVAFDLKAQKVIPTSMLNDEVALQSHTAIYVNKWLVREKPGESVVAFKLPPDQLSKDYLLFTGKPSEIGKFVLPKKE